MFNGVIDISHHNTVTNWDSIKNDGVIAIVHKATEGRSYRDKEYHKRREAAKSSSVVTQSITWPTSWRRSPRAAIPWGQCTISGVDMPPSCVQIL